MSSTKTVLITGCSEGGIGDALAKAFHNKGLRVIATARNLTKIKHLQALGMKTVQLDVTDATSIKQAVQNVSSLTNGTLDFLVNNSGGGYNMPILDSELQKGQDLFNLNVFSVVAVTNAFVPLLKTSKGTLINLGSTAGKSAMPWQAYYNASKAAILTITDSYRQELALFDITVISIIAGGVKTNFWANHDGGKLPAGSLYAPASEEVERVLNGARANAESADVNVFAKSVVANALKSKPKAHHWVGSSAWTIWILSTFGWETVWDLVGKVYFEMGAVNKKIRAAQMSG